MVDVIVPFHMCALTYQPWSTPACLKDEGHVYEARNLEAFIDKYKVSPATGRPVSTGDTVRLHFARNEAANCYDPVTMKEFTDHSHLVAVRPTGHVYQWDTVQRLNIKARNMRDLVTDEPFVRADIIDLQDPHAPEKRRMKDMHRACMLTDTQHNLTLAESEGAEEVNLRATGSASAVVQSVRKAQAERPKSATGGAPDATPAARASHISTGASAASFTSSGLTPKTENEYVAVDEEGLMFERLGAASKKTKAYVKMVTTHGPFNIELHVDKAPKTCYNFVALCRQGQYNGTQFHRNIPGFMIQGGDTGRGGRSIWGMGFEDELMRQGAYRHTSRGDLSMANRGYNTNGSQFFFTYRATPHLDTRHTVFGHLISDVDGADEYHTLDACEREQTDSKDRPLNPIEVLEVQIIEDPFADYMAQLDMRRRREQPDNDERARREAKRRRREEDRTTWLGTNIDGAPAPATPLPVRGAGDHGLSGLGGRPSANSKRTVPQRPGKFGDFSAW